MTSVNYTGLVRVTASGSVITSGTGMTPGSGLYSDDAMFFDFAAKQAFGSPLMLGAGQVDPELESCLASYVKISAGMVFVASPYVGDWQAGMTMPYSPGHSFRHCDTLFD
jgi:hypothetical protein